MFSFIVVPNFASLKLCTCTLLYFNVYFSFLFIFGPCCGVGLIVDYNITKMNPNPFIGLSVISKP